MDSILRIAPYNEEYKCEEDEELADRVLERIRKEQCDEDVQPKLHVSQALDPTVICIVAIRPHWESSRPVASMFLVLASIFVAVAQIAIAYQFYFSHRSVTAANWLDRLNILDRGLTHSTDTSEDKSKLFCLGLYALLSLSHVHKVLRDFLLQVHVLRPLPETKVVLPILAAVALFLDWLAVFASLLSGLVFISETNPELLVLDSDGTVASQESCLPYLQALAVALVMSTTRVWLSHCAVMVVGLVCGREDFCSELVVQLQSLVADLSVLEKSQFVTSTAKRRRALIAVMLCMPVALAWLIYELDCPGHFRNCTGLRLP